MPETQQNNINATKTIIVVATNLDDDDFSILFDNIKHDSEILVVCDNESAEGYKGKIRHITDDLKNHPSLANRIREWALNNNAQISGIIGLDEEYHYSISYNLAKELSLEFYSKDVLDACSNKYLQRSILKKAGVNVPAFELIDRDNPTCKIPFPNVTKLVTGYASSHIYLNQNQDDFNNALDKIRTADHDEIIFSNHTFLGRIIDPKKEIIVEQYIKGTEYSCDYMIHNGTASIIRITRKITKTEKFPFFYGFFIFNPHNKITMPDNVDVNELLMTCKNCAKAIGIKNGICMMDFIISKGKLFVIETTTRPGISTFTDLIAKIYPYTSMDLLIRQKLGLNSDHSIPDKTGLVAYITTYKVGTVERFDTSRLEKMEGFIKSAKFYKPDETIKKNDNLPRLAGYALFLDVKFPDIEHIISETNNNVELTIKK